MSKILIVPGDFSLFFGSSLQSVARGAFLLVKPLDRPVPAVSVMSIFCMANQINYYLSFQIFAYTVKGFIIM